MFLASYMVFVLLSRDIFHIGNLILQATFSSVAKMKIPRRTVPGTVCVSLCLLLLACLLPGSKEQGKQLKFVWFGGETEKTSITEAVNKYMELNPDVTVEILNVEWTRYDEKLMTMLVGRQAPQLARMSAQWCQRYASLGVLADIKDLVSQQEIKDFYPPRLASCEYKGTLVGLPHTSICLMLYYNADVFQQLGIPLPESPEQSWTWHDLEQISRKIQSVGGLKYGWATFKGWFSILSFIYQNGGYILKDNLEEPNFASPECIEAMQWFIDQHKQEIAPASALLGEGAEQLFIRGLCGMVITGNWRVTTFSQRISEFKWDVTYMPRQKKVATNIGGENIVVFRTDQEAEAVKLLLYLTGTEQMKDFCGQTMFIPTRLSLLSDGMEYETHNDMMQKFLHQSRYFEPRWAAEQSTIRFAGISPDITKNLELVLLGNMTVEKAMGNLDEKYRSYEW